jgi:hypothetical protein
MGTIKTIKEAQRYLALCRRDYAFVMCTQTALKTTYLVVPRKPGYGKEMIVSARLHGLFADFLTQHGAKDGLFEGFSQTSQTLR